MSPAAGPTRPIVFAPGCRSVSGDRQQLDDEDHPRDQDDEQQGKDDEGGGWTHPLDDCSRRRRAGVTGGGEITSVTRAGCSLCNEMLPRVETAASRWGFAVRVVDVDRAGLSERYGDRVPVVLDPGGSVVASGRLGAASLMWRLLRLGIASRRSAEL